MMDRKWERLLRLAAISGMLACSDSAETATSTDANGSGGLPGSQPANETPPPGIESSMVDGVWVFFDQPGISPDARLEGTAKIVEGCLSVDEYVVIWKKPDAAAVTTLVESLREGASTRVVLGGAGSSVMIDSAPGDTLGELVRYCSASSVWFSGPLQTGWLVGE